MYNNIHRNQYNPSKLLKKEIKDIRCLKIVFFLTISSFHKKYIVRGSVPRIFDVLTNSMSFTDEEYLIKLPQKT